MTLHPVIAPGTTPDLYAALDHWYRTPLGRHVAAAEAQQLTQLLEATFGYYLLHYGALEPLMPALHTSRVRRRIVLSDSTAHLTRLPPSTPCSAPLLSVQTDFGALPFAADSLDVLVLPHTLEFVADAQQVLCEAERVLIPDGRIVILGFNPLSTWGLRRWWPQCQHTVPWCGRWLTATRLSHWLEVVGLQVEQCDQLVFRPPWWQAFMPPLAWLDIRGARCWRPLGAVYVLQAVKRVSALMPLRWRQRHRRQPLLPGVVVTGAA